jgi:hypothetical protein
MRNVLLGAVLVVLLVAGCGGTTERPVTKKQYEQRIDKIGLSLYDAANALGESTATQLFNDGVDGLREALEDGADQLDGLRPPGVGAQAANDRLIAAYRDLSAEFDKVKEARRQSFIRALKALDAVQKSPPARETLAAAADLRELGYKVPSSATIGSA